MKSRYILIFLICFLLVCLPLSIFPINFFPGVIVQEVNGSSVEIEAPLSLSYFFGLGLNKGDLDGVTAFYLTKQGWALAICLLIGLPAMITYRVYLQGKKKK